jgi:hypothetical protein
MYETAVGITPLGDKLFELACGNNKDCNEFYDAGKQFVKAVEDEMSPSERVETCKTKFHLSC